MKYRNLFFLLALLAGVVLLSACPETDDDRDKHHPPVPAVSGQLTVPERIMLDSDTRDPNNPQVDNNTPATAQPVPNLYLVVGHADNALDPDDYFQVTLDAGETVKLVVGGYSPIDLDLFLYQGGTVVASSTGDNMEEVLTAPAAGPSLVRVSATTLDSNYLLQFGHVGWSPLSAASTAAETDLTEAEMLDASTAEFVPGEVLVKMKAAGGTAALSAAGRGGLRPRAEAVARRHGAEVEDLAPQGLARVSFDAGAAAAGGRDAARARTWAKVRELEADPDVEYAEPNYIAHTIAVPNDTFWTEWQWNLRLINLPRAWDLTTGSPDVVVAVVDCGVLYDHPDLAGNILKDGSTVVGYDFVPEAASNDGDGPDPDPYDSGAHDGIGASRYHGTHVAGIVGAVSDNGLGVAGTAWHVRIMPVRVVGLKGAGTAFDIAEGIKYSAGVDNSSGVYPTVGGVVTPADVISLSLGMFVYSQAMQDAVDLARAAGVTVVAGTGNNDTDKPLYPASCAGVIGVGATGLTGEKACYSNFGPMVDLVAPGGYGRSSETYPNVPLFSDHVLSTCAFGLDAPTSFVYDAKYGTSMATPHVSGVIALMKAYHAMFAAPGDELTPDEIDSLIQGTVKGVDSITDYPAGHRDDGRGYGMIDAYKAVMAARLLAGSAGDDDADLTVSAGEVEFGFTGRKVKVRIGNRGVEPLARVRVVPSSAGWLTATLAGSTLVLYADRTGLPRGYHEATVTVTSKNGGSETITAKMHKGESRPSDIGTVYVVIHDYAYSPVYTTTTSLAQGYRFSFPEASDGYYWLAAGIDLNNNGIIGEKGDILGCYSEYWMPRALFLEMSSGGKPFRGIDFGLNPAIQLTLNMSRVP